MCAPDPNAGIRMQARLRNKEKHALYKSESLKYWNRETAYTRGKQRIAAGKSRTRSDAYSKTLWALGEGRKLKAAAYSKYAKEAQTPVNKKFTSRSYRARNLNSKYLELLNKQGQIESTAKNIVGRNTALIDQQINRQNQQHLAHNRAKLGIRPEFGGPVYLPPKDKVGQMWANIGMAISIASMFVPAPTSDIRAKENISKVGKSNDGHNIYEWNYKTDKNTRYRGVIAQDVVKINPMAVAIRPDGYLGVYYDKLDVDMEVVS